MPFFDDCDFADPTASVELLSPDLAGIRALIETELATSAEQLHERIDNDGVGSIGTSTLLRYEGFRRGLLLVRDALDGPLPPAPVAARPTAAKNTSALTPESVAAGPAAKTTRTRPRRSNS